MLVQSTVMKALSRHELRECTARAISSLPVPLAPRMSSVARVGADPAHQPGQILQ